VVGGGAEVDVYLEVGSKKTFAGAVGWAGWCRSARDEAAALEALLGYGARYRSVLQGTGLVVAAPADVESLTILEACWPARYYVRRAAWHVLDHAWEIVDRL